ncbi:MAG: NADH-quinone oxidoreductase subunit C [Bryobacteraceae bacterium]|nr:NADH-quinone oxidoreductase subunit C [Bryobacteraceae bacterium]
MISEVVLARPEVASLNESLAGAILEGAQTDDIAGHPEVTLIIDPARIVEVARALKAQGFERLCSVTGVDWYPREPRFEVVYHVHSVAKNLRLRLKLHLSSEAAAVDSLTGVWRSANWYEREVFDLFGIEFRNHPDLRRIMMPEGWVGHPLRKDFPVHGYKYSYQDS